MKTEIRVRAPSRRDANRLADKLAREDYVLTVSEAQAVPPLPPAVPAPTRYMPGKYRQSVWQLLSFLEDGVLVIQGTEEAGINFAEDGVDIITGGTGTVDVLEDGA